MYVDSCAFVAAFEGSSGVSSPSRRLFDALAGMPDAAVTSELTLAELIAPSPNAVMTSEERRHLYLELFDGLAIVKLLPVTRAVLLATADVRAQQRFRLADAIHVATAAMAGCRFLMSSDRHARRVPSNLVWLTPTHDDIDAFLADHA